MNLGSSLLDIGYSIALSRFRLVPRRERGAPYPHNPEKRAAQRRGYTAKAAGTLVAISSEYPISNKELPRFIGLLGYWMFRSTPIHAGRR